MSGGGNGPPGRVGAPRPGTLGAGRPGGGGAPREGLTAGGGAGRLVLFTGGRFGWEAAGGGVGDGAKFRRDQSSLTGGGAGA